MGKSSGRAEMGVPSAEPVFDGSIVCIGLVVTLIALRCAALRRCRRLERLLCRIVRLGSGAAPGQQSQTKDQRRQKESTQPYGVPVFHILTSLWKYDREVSIAPHGGAVNAVRAEGPWREAPCAAGRIGLN